MEWLTDPAIWVGLLTLIVLEIVLGIDNLIFIAILADKLPPEQRDRARLIGLSLALRHAPRPARQHPLGDVAHRAAVHVLAPRDLLARPDPDRAAALFLLIKATIEIHDRLEVQAGRPGDGAGACRSGRWWRRSWCWTRCSRSTR